MGRSRLLSRLGLAACLLLLLGGSESLGSQEKQQGPWEEDRRAVTEAAPWARARYEAVKKHLGAVGALSKQYWQYLACKVSQEGCEEEGKRKAGPSPGKLPPLPFLCPGNSSGTKRFPVPAWGSAPPAPVAAAGMGLPPLLGIQRVPQTRVLGQGVCSQPCGSVSLSEPAAARYPLWAPTPEAGQ